MKTIKTLRSLAIVTVILLLGHAASAADTSEDQPGTYKLGGKFKGVSFTRTVIKVVNNVPYHSYSGVSGSGVLKNDKDEVVAEGELQAVEGFIGLKAKRGGTFFYVPVLEKYSSPGWTEKPTPALASLRYGKDNRWELTDTNFLFLLKPGSFGSGSISLELTASITRQSVVQLPVGSYKMFGYKIESSKEGATVKFSYGKVVGTAGCTAPEDKSGKQ